MSTFILVTSLLAPVQTRSSAPAASSTTSRLARQRVVPNRKARVRQMAPAKSKHGSAELAALLRAFVAGEGRSKFERRVLRKLEKKNRGAASRILSRLDASSSSARTRALGSTNTRTRAFKKALEAAVAQPSSNGNIQFLLPAYVLPPENAPAISEFELRRRGVVTLATEDADGTDELSTMLIWVTMSGDGYQLTTVDAGTGATMGEGAAPLPKAIYDGFARDAILVSAMIEDDNGNAAAAREEIEVLVQLAASVATTMQGDRMHVFKTMLDYTLTLDSVGADPSRAARSVVANSITAGSWKGLYAASTSTTAGLDWKIAVPHAMGNGRYELLLDVPSKPLPPMPTVRLATSKLVPATTLPNGFELFHVDLEVSINAETAKFELDADDLERTRVVERMVDEGEVSIQVKARGKYREPGEAKTSKKCFTGANGEEHCITIVSDVPKVDHEKIDLGAGSTKTLTTTYSTELDSFVSGGPGRPTKVTRKVFHGTDNPAARITLSVRDYNATQGTPKKRRAG